MLHILVGDDDVVLVRHVVGERVLHHQAQEAEGGGEGGREGGIMSMTSVVGWRAAQYARRGSEMTRGGITCYHCDVETMNIYIYIQVR